jgi:hypothetical protein
VNKVDFKGEARGNPFFFFSFFFLGGGPHWPGEGGGGRVHIILRERPGRFPHVPPMHMYA